MKNLDVHIKEIERLMSKGFSRDAAIAALQALYIGDIADALNDVVTLANAARGD